MKMTFIKKIVKRIKRNKNNKLKKEVNKIMENKKYKKVKYRIKRYEKGMTIYTIARELGIDYHKYLEVDRGERPLEGKYVDKFNEIMDNAPQVKLERAKRLIKVKEFFSNRELCQKKLKEYGVTCASLGKILGFSQSGIYTAIFDQEKASDDLKEMIYDWLNDPMNKKIKDEKEDTSKLAESRANEEQKVEDSINISEEDKETSEDAESVNNKDEDVTNEETCHIETDSENFNESEKELIKVIECLKDLNISLIEEKIQIQSELDKCKHQIEMYEILIKRLK